MPDEADPDSIDFEAVSLLREAAFKSVQRAVRGLTSAGAIRVRRSPRVGQRAKYSLPVDLWKAIALSEPIETKSVRLDRTQSVHLVGTESDRSSDANRPPKKPQEPLEDLSDEGYHLPKRP